MKYIDGTTIQFEPASHEDITDPGVLKKVLVHTGELMDGSIMMLNWASLPKRKSFQYHYHETLQEVFIIIKGNAMMKIDSKELNVKAGDAIVVDPMEKHFMKNTSDDTVEYIVFGVASKSGGRTINVS